MSRKPSYSSWQVAGVSLLIIPTMVIYFPFWQPDIAMEKWTIRRCISLFKMKSFHSHLGFPELQTPAFGGKQILHQKTSQAVDFNGTKISEILDQNRTCARSIQTPKGTPNRLHLCRYRSSKTEIIKMVPILGGVKLDANVWYFLWISIEYCIVWVGNIMTPAKMSTCWRFV